MKKVSIVILVGFALMLGAGCQQRTAPGTSKGTIKGLKRIHFAYDDAAVKSEYKKTLQRNKKFLEANPKVRATIEGHCDERGTEEYNIALGHRRAKATKSYLVSLGISSRRLRAKSYGEERPLERCHNESCWWKNRRAEFVKR